MKEDQRSVAPIPQMVDARLSCMHHRQRFFNLVELTSPQASIYHDGKCIAEMRSIVDALPAGTCCRW
jgi:hypothetical protein